MGCAGSTASTPTPTATSAVPSGPPFEDRVKNAFAASFDLNGDGVLDIAEVLKFLMLSGQSSVDMEIAQQFMDAFSAPLALPSTPHAPLPSLPPAAPFCLPLRRRHPTPHAARPTPTTPPPPGPRPPARPPAARRLVGQRQDDGG